MDGYIFGPSQHLNLTGELMCLKHQFKFIIMKKDFFVLLFYFFIVKAHKSQTTQCNTVQYISVVVTECSEYFRRGLCWILLHLTAFIGSSLLSQQT